MSASYDVIVVGGGLVGSACALEVARSGASVLVVERGPGWAAGCSAGNAGLITASLARPLASVANIRAAARSLLGADEAFRFTPHRSLASWLPRFFLASWGAAHASRSKQLLQLATASTSLYQEWSDEGLTAPFHRGLVHAYLDPRSMDAGQAGAEADRLAGLAVDVLDGPAARRLEPALSPHVAGALYYPDDLYCDPGEMNAAFGAAALDAGAEPAFDTEVLDWHRRGSEVTGLLTTRGQLRARQYVLAAGLDSARLASMVGVRLPIEAGKGYSIDVDANVSGLSRAVILPESHTVATPMGDRIRFAARIELTGGEDSVSPAVVEHVVDSARLGLTLREEVRIRTVWRGMRPCSPDGLPMIGRTSRVSNLTVATGHGMLGLTLAPVTARRVRELLSTPSSASSRVRL